MKFKGAIFDLDGTLADSIQDLGDSMNFVLCKQGMPTHTYEAYKYYVGKGIRNLVVESLPKHHRSEALINTCLDQFVSHYEENCLNKTKLYEGTEHVLLTLKTDGIKMAVFSNKREELTRKVVDTLFPSDFFEIVLGARPDLPKKPDPDGALHISTHLDIDPKKIVYLGDTNIDMKTANNAGMYAIGVSWGFRTRGELEAAGARAILDHPRDLLLLMRS